LAYQKSLTELRKPYLEDFATLTDLIRSKGTDPKVAAIGLFGSVAKGQATDRSDIDLLELRTDVKSHFAQRIHSEDTVIDLQIWPVYEFAKLLFGESSSALYEAFKFDALRTTKILYDPRRLLGRLKAYAMTNRVPISCRMEVLRRAQLNLEVAERLLMKKNERDCEITIRHSVDDVARGMLLKNDFASLNPMRSVLAQLGLIDQDLREFLLKAYGFDNTSLGQARNLIKEGGSWVKRLNETIETLRSPVDVMPLVVTGERRIADAERAFERGDYLGAVILMRQGFEFLNRLAGGLHETTDLRQVKEYDPAVRSEVNDVRVKLLGLNREGSQLQGTLRTTRKLIAELWHSL